jgi:ABC-type polysaccharide/polyol phosphate transport system ATPase subunit
MTDLRFERVSKRYRIQSDDEFRRSGLRARARRLRDQKKDFWAVKDVSFEVQRGESLGIIGHNGAGKSTILKLLSNITTPTRGEITINGRLSALLEVGSGFHPELTGRENIYLSGSILGMRRAEITRKLDSIIDFSGVRPFMDVPVKRYSSGMYVRLGFSITAHLDPDILLLDEVLAVGDIAFQEKCKKRIGELHRRGTTLVFISHDLTAVRNLCQRVLLLQKGEILATGDPDEIIRRYTQTASFHQTSRAGDTRVARITNVSFSDARRKVGTGFLTGEPMTARVEYLLHDQIHNGSVSLYFVSSEGSIAAQWTTSLDGAALNMNRGAGSIEFNCAELGLQPGVYQIDACVEHAGTKEILGWQHGCTSIHVDAGKKIQGNFYMPHSWRQTSASRGFRDSGISEMMTSRVTDS